VASVPGPQSKVINPLPSAFPTFLLLQACGATTLQVGPLAFQCFYSFSVLYFVFSVWITNKTSKLFQLQSSCYTSGYALRQKMLNFVQNLQYYMMVEVIEPNWVLFEKSLQSVSSVWLCIYSSKSSTATGFNH
jgi:gamma-tubulin complex component 2